MDVYFDDREFEKENPTLFGSRAIVTTTMA